MTPVPVHFFTELPSTSTKAQELLRAGEPLPFAVHALSQTAGRGRRGNTWISPEGNLHFSMVLPAPRQGSWTMASLRVGALLAEWMNARFRFRPTLKWPNDVLFGGRKLGGILCESSSSSDAAPPIVVGIGLNLRWAPTTDVAQNTLSLSQIIPGSFAANDLARELADALARSWDILSDDDVRKIYENFAIPAGHLWRADDQEWVRGNAIAPDGSMTFHGTSGPRTVVSTDPSLRWFAQLDAPFLLVFLDVGNTRVKFWERAQGIWETPLPSAINSAAELPLARWRDQERVLIAASVRPETLRSLASDAERLGLKLMTPAKRSVLLQTRYDLTQIGMDRLALMEGYLSNLSVEQRGDYGTALILGLGTAITVDVVRRNGEHLGGWILPGMRMGLEALHKGTGLLPHVNLTRTDEAAPKLGLNTEQALADGQRAMILGLVAAAEKAAGTTFSDIVLTGGDATLAQNVLPAARVDQTLLFTGLLSMTYGGLVR